MMVKSISHSSRGQYKFKKKKIWININEHSDVEDIEYETEVIEICNFLIYLYNKKGKLILHKKVKQQINILV
jgi:hypothetical protein